MDELKKLQEQRMTLAAKIREIGNKVDSWTEEDRATYTAVNNDYDAVMAKITEANAKIDEQAKIANRLQEVEAYRPNNSRIGRDSGTIERGPANQSVFGGVAGVDNQSLAMQAWFMHGAGLQNEITDQHRTALAATGRSVNDREFVLNLSSTAQFAQTRNHLLDPRNALTVGTPETGGHTVGSTLIASLEKAMLDYSGVMQVAEIIRTGNGEPFAWPTIDDTANTGSRVGEGQDAGTASDPVLGRTTWSAYDFTSGLLNVSRSLLSDSIFNFVPVIGGLMGERLGRKQNTDYTTGGGGGLSPAGIVTRSYLGKTAASATAIVWDELIDLEHSVDPSRRNQPGVGYMMNDAILQGLRKLKDGNGQPIWQSGWNAGMPDLINNRRYWVNQAMSSTIASGAKSILFGQLSQYKVRQVGQIVIQRLVERRAEYNQDVFIAYMRGDGNLLDAGDHPVKHLVH